MATPVAHSLFSFGVFVVNRRAGETFAWRFYIFAVITANGADFDFIPGVILGDVNEFHRDASHSLGATVIIGMLALDNLIETAIGDVSDPTSTKTKSWGESITCVKCLKIVRMVCG